MAYARAVAAHTTHARCPQTVDPPPSPATARDLGIRARALERQRTTGISGDANRRPHPGTAPTDPDLPSRIRPRLGAQELLHTFAPQCSFGRGDRRISAQSLGG